MKILITGIVLLVIWCIVSAWLYNDKLMPVIMKPETSKVIPKTMTNEADSLMKIKASMPENLLIYFEFDKTKFNPDPQNENSVTEFKAWLEKYPQSVLLVTGHTDMVGTIEYNYDLALKRAEIVGKYVESKGINSGRMVVSSKGETEPAADYLSHEGRAKSRRTEISLKMQ
jgi:outer membrane protein OmpA-like peptidoglycan-associated protein